MHYHLDNDFSLRQHLSAPFPGHHDSDFALRKESDNYRPRIAHPF